MTPPTDRRTALVTGSSRGLGRAIALRFAEDGYRVAVHCLRNRQAAEDSLAALPGDGHVLVEGPLATPGEARALFAAAVERLGRVDVLVNNAGVYVDHHPLETSFEEWNDAWRETIGVNLLGPAYLCHEAMGHMRGLGGGSIINITSRGAYRGEPYAPAYAASKAGLGALTQSLSAAGAPVGVYVFGVAPGWIDTDMAAPYLAGRRGEAIRRQSPLGRVAKPEEIARIVVFLASPESSWMTGAIVDANGASYFR